MKQFSTIQLQLLQYLTDGHCHQNITLSKQLNISGAAIERYINQLVEDGVPIQHLPSQSYQLATAIKLLDEKLIRQHLESKQFLRPFDFHLFSTINSTNQFLKEFSNNNVTAHPAPTSRGLDWDEQLPNSLLAVCCAEKQTHGRGRFGRQWFSPFGENIYCSSRWTFNCNLSCLSGLSLVVGLAILESLQEHKLCRDLRIKWPNDLLWGNKKLGGILIEIVSETNNHTQLIIGIGLNVNTTAQSHVVIGSPWCSLYEITGLYFDRNRLLADILYRLDQFMTQFLTFGFAAFMPAWQTIDYLHGQWITVTQHGSSISGEACGINEFGQLRIKDGQGVIHSVSSGDASLSNY